MDFPLPMRTLIRQSVHLDHQEIDSLDIGSKTSKYVVLKSFDINFDVLRMNGLLRTDCINSHTSHGDGPFAQDRLDMVGGASRIIRQKHFPLGPPQRDVKETDVVPPI